MSEIRAIRSEADYKAALHYPDEFTCSARVDHRPGEAKRSEAGDALAGFRVGPQADQLFLLQDNWPVHQHAELVAALRDSKFTLVPLPTYAPWLNPMEKVW